MKKNPKKLKFDIGDGRIMEFETGKLANQADGSVVLKFGKTMILATVVSKKESSKGIDFLPLSVDYREQFAAAGRFPGGFFKRESRPSNYEILISRLIDRALRPLFPNDYRCETQVLLSLISADKENLPDAISCTAASMALMLSDIPFEGPVAEVRVSRINNVFKCNPTKQELENADIELIVAGTEKNIVMVEGEMKEVSENEMIEAIKFAHQYIKLQCHKQKEFVEEVLSKRNIREYERLEDNQELKDKIFNETEDKFYSAAKLFIDNKKDRKKKFDDIIEEYISGLDKEFYEENQALIDKYLSESKKLAIRKMILKEKKRLDGRTPDEIRPIYCEVDYLPGAHGSAIFTRGETQALATVTLGTKLDEQTIESAIFQDSENFMLHYNFPPFSTGEVRPLRAVSRREIGHGNLAQRALKPVIPSGVENPYTIRIVSDILESNGSSSMATVCAGTLALMDAGVQILKPVSGIAMGLITDKATGNYVILSDILGDEDHLGDMDFKVTGTKDGITACQMDIKIDGLSFEVLREALEQAKKARLYILDKMLETMPKPRNDYKDHAPRIEQIIINKEFIGAVIGPGGSVIQKLQKDTGAKIVIDEVDEVGVVDIVAENKDSIEQAKNKILEIAAVPEVGKIYKGKVISIQPYGAFVEILPGKTGLLHISEIEWRRLNKVEEVLKEGDEIEVKLLGIDTKNGKLKLSRKVLLKKPYKTKA